MKKTYKLLLSAILISAFAAPTTQIYTANKNLSKEKKVKQEDLDWKTLSYLEWTKKQQANGSNHKSTYNPFKDKTIIFSSLLAIAFSIKTFCF
jgi:Ni/Co efflux regulator RcnB